MLRARYRTINRSSRAASSDALSSLKAGKENVARPLRPQCRRGNGKILGVPVGDDQVEADLLLARLDGNEVGMALRPGPYQ